MPGAPGRLGISRWNPCDCHGRRSSGSPDPEEISAPVEIGNDGLFQHGAIQSRVGSNAGEHAGSARAIGRPGDVPANRGGAKRKRQRLSGGAEVGISWRETSGRGTGEGAGHSRRFDLESVEQRVWPQDTLLSERNAKLETDMER